MRRSYLSAVILVPVLLLTACNTKSKKTELVKDRIAGNDSIGITFKLVTDSIKVPVELNVAPDHSHRLFITDNKGKIWILKNDSLLPKPFFNIYDQLGKQDIKSALGSIYSVTFHPGFATNNKFYVCYSAPTKIHANPCKLVVSEFTACKTSQDSADMKTGRPVFEVEGKNIGFNGAQIASGPDGYLYISIGDDKLGDSTYHYHAQDLSLLNGKLLRIEVNKTPVENPCGGFSLAFCKNQLSQL